MDVVQVTPWVHQGLVSEGVVVTISIGYALQVSAHFMLEHSEHVHASYSVASRASSISKDRNGILAIPIQKLRWAPRNARIQDQDYPWRPPWSASRVALWQRTQLEIWWAFGVPGSSQSVWGLWSTAAARKQIRDTNCRLSMMRQVRITHYLLVACPHCHWWSLLVRGQMLLMGIILISGDRLSVCLSVCQNISLSIHPALSQSCI